ncbi:carboxylesterase/lipase family protein [Shewanella sp. YIC-542]|uniref:carboxylesterase/lipase family protein n=1 Tax=Shewanella mytili TaxID=3377111 RepID=UPI00398EAA5E
MNLLKWTAALCCLAAAAVASAKPGPIVQIQSGRIEGMQQHNVDAFLGIPYAKAPLGDLRWQRPLTAVAWRGIKKAVAFGPSCMQAPAATPGVTLPGNYSEDCLTLNVWRPSHSKGPAPVMVWFHGGGLVNGGSAAPQYDGSAFARAGVMFVSINYRLGRLGFFAHPAMDGNMFVGNFGYTDQIKALRWVQDNIIQFGGNPRNITLFGDEAGGYAVHALLSSRFGRDLFQKAIIQSGNGRYSPAGAQSWEQAKAAGMAFSQRQQINGSDKIALQALRKLPANVITGDLNLQTLAKNRLTYSGPMIDGQVVEKSPQDAYRKGDFARVPLLIGTDGRMAGNRMTPAPITTDRQTLLAQFAADSTAASRAYGAIEDDHTLAQRIALQKTQLEPTRFVARTFANRQTPVWQYRFAYQPEHLATNSLGALPFIFNTLPSVSKQVSEHDQQLAHMLLQYWVNFAKNGDPNGDTLPTWQPYNSAKDNILSINRLGVTAMQTDPQQAQLDLIEKRQP